MVTNQLKAREIRDLVRAADQRDLELFYFGINLKNAAFRSTLDSLHDESIFFISTLDSAFVRLFLRNLSDFQSAICHVQEISVDDNSLQISDEFATKLSNLRALSIESFAARRRT